MRALVVSGGGCKIGFGLGAARELHKKHQYNLYIGISAGAIISSFAATGLLDYLYQELLNIKISDVFSVCPINKKGNLSFLAKLRLLLGKSSLGKNKRFRTKLKSILTKEHFTALKKSQKEVKVGVTNYTLLNVEYPSSNYCNYEDFMDWVYTSSNIPCVAEPMKLNDFWYFDGSVVDYVGIYRAIKDGATEIDVILHEPMEYQVTEEDLNWEPTNILEITKRTMQIFLKTITVDDILIGKTTAMNKRVKINFYYPPFVLTDEMFLLDKKATEDFHNLGAQVVNNPLVFDTKCTKSLIL